MKKEWIVIGVVLLVLYMIYVKNQQTAQENLAAANVAKTTGVTGLLASLGSFLPKGSGSGGGGGGGGGGSKSSDSDDDDDDDDTDDDDDGDDDDDDGDDDNSVGTYADDY